MMRQYLDAKEQYPDAILFFRMGDFYEMFFEDAIVSSRELGITLTARNKGEEHEVPMAGVPHHSAAGYVNTLIEKGFTVAICEQLEAPSAGKKVVKRDVVRVVTPGVVLDTDSLDAKAPNFVAAVYQAPKSELFGIAYADVSTGDFRATEVATFADLASELRRFEPREILVNETAGRALDPDHVRLDGIFVRTKAEPFFDRKKLRGDVARGVRLADDIENDGYFLDETGLDALYEETGEFEFTATDSVEQAVTGVLRYLTDTQRGIPSHMRAVEPYHARSFLIVDEATKANLELTETLMGGRRVGSLLHIIDRTVTAMGGRLLRHWLAYPLVNPGAIEARLDAVQELVSGPALRDDVRTALDDVYDLERLCGKISSGTANARDLRSLLTTLDAVDPVRDLLSDCETERLRFLSDALDPFDDLRSLIDSAIVEEPPVAVTEGGLFKKGYDPELDEVLEVAENGKDWLLQYEIDQKERTDIGSLKVRHNKVFGYYIEVTKANLDLVPDDYVRKQTLTNAERYFTPELKEMEEKILGAEDRRQDLEYRFFEDLRRTVGEEIAGLLRTARHLAEVDVLAAFSELAVRNEYVRPEIVDDGTLEIEEGRHPVVERTIEDEQFVPNSVYLDTEEHRLQIVTGPNMAGKSTVIRQVALISLIAQMGCFVPARAARIGIVDKIFSRVGASDNLARGQSTFMVEMTETAHILANATERSLVILDEIGRGTSTFDGLSIAWAVAEYLHDDVGAKTMFATHYHELTELSRTLPGAENLSIAVKEWQDDIIFLRKLVEGEANRSYGVQVAKLAGLPATVIERARTVLENLEEGQFDERGLPIPSRGRPATATKNYNPDQLSLFATGDRLSDGEREALETLRGLKPETLTPIEALNLIAGLTEQLEE
jgi:DNA mismatch repair protein MutS